MKTWKKRSQKLLIIGPDFFFSNANGPKSSPNLNSCSIKISHRLLYNDFDYHTWKKLYILIFPLFSPHMYVTQVGKQAFQLHGHAIFPTTSFALQCMSIFFSPFLEKDYLVRTIKKNLCWWWSFARTTDAQWSLFSLKSRTFWLGQTNWADKFRGIWVIFGQTISTHFGTVSPLSMFSIIQPLFLQKTRPFTSHLFGIGIWIWAEKN